MTFTTSLSSAPAAGSAERVAHALVTVAAVVVAVVVVVVVMAVAVAVGTQAWRRG